MNKETKHICFFNSHKKWGGGEKWHMETVLHLHSKNHPVIVCGSSKGEFLKRIPQSIPRMKITFSNVSFLNPFNYIRCYRFFKKQHIKTIILCLPIDVKIAGVAAKLAGIKNIVYRRGCAIPIKNTVSNRFLFSHIITHIIANSHATKESILAHNPDLFPRKKITVLYNGIHIHDVPDKTGDLNKKTIIIGTAGRLEPQKNMLAIISIAKIIRLHTSNFIIRIAGDGSQYSQLKKEITINNLEKNIQLLGFQKDMNRFYQSLDMFILTSHGEGFGYVLAEAMMHKIPIIAYDNGSSKELIKENSTGFLIPEHAIEQFAQKIEKLIKNPTLRIKMGENARTYVTNNFDAEITYAQTETFIVNL